MDVSIIIVNYKTSTLVRNCINSIISKTDGIDYEVIIVDNSNDIIEYEKLEDLKKEFSSIDVKLIDAKGNIGFGRANNLGVRDASGEKLFFLNSDTLLENNAVFKLYSFLRENLNVGIAGSFLFNKEGEPTHSFVRKERVVKKPQSQLSPIYLIKKLFHREVDYPLNNKPVKVTGYICGAALMINKDLFESVKGFDEEIFMYGEDTLLCGLVRKCGKELYCVPSSKITHLEGASDSTIYSDFKIENYVNGVHVCIKKLYGEKYAIKYLKSQAKTLKIKSVILKMMGKKNNSINKRKLSVGFLKKYNESKV